MKKIFSKLIPLLLCAVAALTTLCLHVSAKGEELYYGREALSKLDNSAALIYAYDSMQAGVESSAAEIDVYNGNDPISPDEIRTVFDAFVRDRCEYFWLGNQYTMVGTDSTVTQVIPKYTMTGKELNTAKAEFNKAVSAALSGIDSSMTEFETELYLHDLLAKSTEYADVDNAHNAYGALVGGKAVCEGYAKAFGVLLQRAGIRSFLAMGQSLAPATNSYEPHCWNIVRIDGKHYHTDLTWNDQESHTYHAYFNLTTTAILADHALTPADFPMPLCNSDEAMYFKVKGGIIDTLSTEQIAELLRESGLSAGVYVKGSMDIFLDWLEDSIYTIGAQSGAEQIYNYSYSSLGKEVFITVRACLHDELTHKEAIPATCTENGRIEHYLCVCGAAFADADGKMPIDEEFLTVHAAHDYDTSDWSYFELRGHGYACKHCTAHTWPEPHSIGPEATADSPQICLDCGYIITPKLSGGTAADTEKPTSQGKPDESNKASETQKQTDAPPPQTALGCKATASSAAIVCLCLVISCPFLRKRTKKL